MGEVCLLGRGCGKCPLQSQAQPGDVWTEGISNLMLEVCPAPFLIKYDCKWPCEHLLQTFYVPGAAMKGTLLGNVRSPRGRKS